jgi:actin-like ATPase involved in cell morphogenesis
VYKKSLISGALLNNLDQLLSEEIGLAITVPDNPSSTVVLGAAKVLENLNVFNRSTKFISTPILASCRG